MNRSPVHGDDLDASVAGLAGWYAVRDLYARYCGHAQANGRSPAAIRVYARALSSSGHPAQVIRETTCRLVVSSAPPAVEDPVPVEPLLAYTP